MNPRFAELAFAMVVASSTQIMACAEDSTPPATKPVSKHQEGKAKAGTDSGADNTTRNSLPAITMEKFVDDFQKSQAEKFKDPLFCDVYEFCEQECWTMQMLDTERIYTPLKLGTKQLANGEALKAVSSFTEAIDASPQYPGGYEARAEAYKKLGRTAESASDLKEALQLSKARIPADLKSPKTKFQKQ